MYPCPECDKSFQKLRGLRDHQSKAHRKFQKGCCIHCGTLLTESNQRPSDRKRNLEICITCKKQQAKSYRDGDAPRYKKYSLKSRAKRTPKQIEHNRRICHEGNDRRRKRLKLEIVEAYGGQCACCGESEIGFLTIDHIYGDGSDDRPWGNPERGQKGSRASGVFLYFRIKREGFPKDRYRLLCYNCNCAMGHLGYCPHQKQLELFSGLPKLLHRPYRYNAAIPLAAD